MALAPILAYGFVYKYEAAVCESFGLASDIIRLSTWQVVGMGLKVLSALAIGLLSINALSIVLLNSDWGRQACAIHRAILIRWSILAPISIISLWCEPGRGRVITLCLVSLFALIDFVIPGLARGGKRWVRAINDAEEKEVQLSRLTDFLPSVWVKLLFAVWVVFLSLNLTSQIGGRAADRQVLFKVAQINSREYAILRVYDGTAYCAAYDETTRALTGEYCSTDMSDLNWKIDRIGPLSKPAVLSSDEQGR
ncbi:MAG: hypothetical protein JSW71_06160 [Gemmatimonadota bacterium]|nr:MAG: hypothetical protein JSW71_06160 [Gemmatimonadota bacterium]